MGQKAGAKSVLQYRYHGRKEKSSCRLIFLADHFSQVSWNGVDHVCGRLGYSIHKLGEYIQVCGNIHGAISHPSFVQLFISDTAAGSVDNIGLKDHPGFAIHHWMDSG